MKNGAPGYRSTVLIRKEGGIPGYGNTACFKVGEGLCIFYILAG